MKNLTNKPALLLIVTLLGACSSIPTATSLLDQTHGEFLAAQTNPNVARYAPLELKQGGEMLQQADHAAAEHERADKIDQLAYLARQKIAQAQEISKQKTAEASIAGAAAQRDEMRLAQRTNEADRAKLDAEQARSAAEMSKADALKAQAAANQSMSDAAQAKAAADLSRDQAANAERDTRDAQARSAQLQAQLAELAAKQTERGMVITLGDVLFNTNMANLSQDGARTLHKLANVLQQNPSRTVLIEGFTDSTGSADHNQELSERRAGAVRASLMEMGIGSDRVAMRGYGVAYPVAPNTTAANRQLNRRVEIVLSDASGKVSQR
jgi:outer membrane protein OmpA-like peptidoglycan-associated protein